MNPVYSLDTIALEILSDNRPLLDWVHDYLSPFFSVENTPATLWTARAHSDTASWKIAGEAFRNLRRHFPTNTHPEQTTSWHMIDSGVWSVEQQDPDIRALTWYWTLDLPQRLMDVHVLAGEEESPYVVARLCRTLMMGLGRKLGWWQLHGSCFALDGKGILVTGNKRAGKTTFLIAGLKDLGGAFVSNDRILLKRTEGGMVAHGLPHSVNIRLSTLEKLEKEESQFTTTYYHQSPSKKRFLVRELCELLGVDIQNEVPLASVIFPRYSEETFSFIHMSGEEAATTLARQRFASLCDYQPLWDTPFPVISEWPDRLSIPAWQVTYDDDNLVHGLEKHLLLKLKNGVEKG